MSLPRTSAPAPSQLRPRPPLGGNAAGRAPRNSAAAPPVPPDSPTRCAWFWPSPSRYTSPIGWSWTRQPPPAPPRSSSPVARGAASSPKACGGSSAAWWAPWPPWPSSPGWSSPRCCSSSAWPPGSGCVPSRAPCCATIAATPPCWPAIPSPSWPSARWTTPSGSSISPPAAPPSSPSASCPRGWCS